MWPWRKRKTAAISDGVRICGRVEADGDLELAGEVHGDLLVAGTLVLRETARLYGDIRCSALQIEQGAVFAGTNRMGDGGEYLRTTPTPVQPPAPAPAEPADTPLAILMAPVGVAEKEALGVIPKGESPAFCGGFNPAVKGL
ncbi:MAG: Polymer-forming cytoskeletal [Symbiobacteriaceae bacterium]|jgi:hypothetical protein|nr:Polymer-forming cytoskeletal [Symbiobacteriaceae bacterium]